MTPWGWSHDPMRPLDVIHKVGDPVDVAGQGVCTVVEVEPRRMVLKRRNGNLLEVTISDNEPLAGPDDKPVLREFGNGTKSCPVPHHHKDCDCRGDGGDR